MGKHQRQTGFILIWFCLFLLFCTDQQPKHKNVQLEQLLSDSLIIEFEEPVRYLNAHSLMGADSTDYGIVFYDRYGAGKIYQLKDELIKHTKIAFPVNGRLLGLSRWKNSWIGVSDLGIVHDLSSGDTLFNGLNLNLGSGTYQFSPFPKGEAFFCDENDLYSVMIGYPYDSSYNLNVSYLKDTFSNEVRILCYKLGDKSDVFYTQPHRFLSHFYEQSTSELHPTYVTYMKQDTIYFLTAYNPVLYWQNLRDDRRGSINLNIPLSDNTAQPDIRLNKTLRKKHFFESESILNIKRDLKSNLILVAVKKPVAFPNAFGLEPINEEVPWIIYVLSNNDFNVLQSINVPALNYDWKNMLIHDRKIYLKKINNDKKNIRFDICELRALGL